jgi:hypothetical protein
MGGAAGARATEEKATMMIPAADLLSLFMLMWVKNSIVVTAGFIILSLRRVFRLKSGTLWMMVFTSVAVLPVLNAVLPLWNLPLLPVDHRLVQANIPLGAARISFIEGIAVVWAAGVLVSISGLVLDHLRARRLIDLGLPALDERLSALLARARAALGCIASPRIVLTRSLSTPALVGLTRPVLLLPPESCALETRIKALFAPESPMTPRSVGPLVLAACFALMAGLRFGCPGNRLRPGMLGDRTLPLLSANAEPNAHAA